MIESIFLLIIPLAMWIVIAKVYFRHEFTSLEMTMQFALTSLVIVALMFVGNDQQTRDYKIVNGVVTQTIPEKRNCDMTWSDWADSFCTNQYTRRVKSGETCSTVNGVRTCTPTYKTQYKSVYPWEQRYFIRTDIGFGYEIARIDKQGVQTPPRFSIVKTGDPVADFVSYTNYIKGAASTLFNKKYEHKIDVLYPGQYDYYKIDRVSYLQGDRQLVKQWNESLSRLNADIRKTGANVIVVVTSQPQDWAEQLAQSWDAHNINDVVVVIGERDSKISWVDVRSWSENKLVNIVIRDEILNIGVVDPDKINDIVYKAVTSFYKQQPMENFEYLADDIATPLWVIILASLILIVITPTVTWVLSNNNERSFK